MEDMVRQWQGYMRGQSCFRRCVVETMRRLSEGFGVRGGGGLDVHRRKLVYRRVAWCVRMAVTPV